MINELKERILGVFEELVAATYLEQTGKVDVLIEKLKKYAYSTKPADLEKKDFVKILDKVRGEKPKAKSLLKKKDKGIWDPEAGKDYHQKT